MSPLRKPKPAETNSLLHALRIEVTSGELEAKYKNRLAETELFVKELKSSDRIDPKILRQPVTI